MRYGKVDLKKSFNVFRKKLINYAIKEIKNAEGSLMFIQDLKDTKYFVNNKNNQKDPTTGEARS